MVLLKLFFSFLNIGLFSFGGGYAAIPLIKEAVVNQHGWISLNELSNIIAISSLTPGPVGINSAIFIGRQIGGFAGSCVATLAFIIPSFIIVSFLAHFYSKYKQINLMQALIGGLRPAIVAIILGAGLTIFLNAVPSLNYAIDYIQILLFIGAFYLAFFKKISPIKIFILTIFINILLYYIMT
ncbi:MAG: chromate transporter [Erysipelotrichales bacterium]